MAPPRSRVRNAVLETFRAGILNADEVRDKMLNPSQYGAMHPLMQGDMLNEGTPNVPDLPTLQERDRVTSQMLGNVPVIADPRMPRDTIAQVNPNGVVTVIDSATGRSVSFDAHDIAVGIDPVGRMGDLLREYSTRLQEGSEGVIRGTIQHSDINWDAMGQILGVERDKLPPNQPKYTLEDLPHDDFEFENRTW